MKVELLTFTPDPENIVAAAARVCYSPLGGDELMENLNPKEAKAFIHKLMEMGHDSPLEHVGFTFAIDGVSRVLSHQLVRHRIGASYSQKSQRYVKEQKGQTMFILPPSIKNNSEAMAEYQECMERVFQSYDALCKLVPPEDARYVLPNATCTNLVVTFNARSLLHFFELRCCMRAQWEIRDLAEEMLRLVREIAPAIFAYAGPTCETLGICFEGEKSCGRVKNVVSRRYQEEEMT